MSKETKEIHENMAKYITEFMQRMQDTYPKDFDYFEYIFFQLLSASIIENHGLKAFKSYVEEQLSLISKDGKH